MTSSATGMMQKATMMAPFFQSRLWVLNGISSAVVATASVCAVVMMLSFLDYDCRKEGRQSQLAVDGCRLGEKGKIRISY